jgi:eukaryotic-like serine/threonine-protein kinase
MKKEPERAIGYLIEALEMTRKRVGPDHGDVASGNRAVGSVFIRLGKFAEAEPYLRESWRIYLQNEPDSLQTFWSESLLGVSLLGQKKFAEAEPRLLSGYQGIKARDGTLSPQQKSQGNQALDRIIQLYDEWGRKDKADEWRKVRLSMNTEAQAKP